MLLTDLVLVVQLVFRMPILVNVAEKTKRFSCILLTYNDGRKSTTIWDAFNELCQL